jgi:hypothetical protein
MVLTVAIGLIIVFARADNTSLELAAQNAAGRWLALVDAGKYEESREVMASSFKTAVSRRAWKSTIAEIRKPLGEVVSRKLKSVEFTKELPGAPDGEYVVIKFDTTFQNKTNAVETVTPVLEADLVWRVSGYSVK